MAALPSHTYTQITIFLRLLFNHETVVVVGLTWGYIVVVVIAVTVLCSLLLTALL